MGRSFLPVLQAFNVMSDNNWKADMSRFCSATCAFAPLKTADFDADMTTFGYPCDTSAGVINADLPPANGILGKPYFFKRTAGANNLRIRAASGDTIDGAAILTLGAVGDKATIYSDGVSKWYRTSS